MRCFLDLWITNCDRFWYFRGPSSYFIVMFNLKNFLKTVFIIFVNWKEREMRGSVLFVQIKLSRKIWFYNVLPPKTVMPAMEEILMSTFSCIRLKFCMNYLILQRWAFKTVWIVLNTIEALCNHRSCQWRIVLRS